MRQFIHNCLTMPGSSGSSIIFREDSTIIGLHHSSFTEDEKEKKNPLNISTPIFLIIQDLIAKIKSNNRLISRKNNIMNPYIPLISNINNKKLINYQNNNVINNNIINLNKIYYKLFYQI